MAARVGLTVLQGPRGGLVAQEGGAMIGQALQDDGEQYLRWAGIGFLVAGPLFGLLFFGIAIRYWQRSREVATWPAVPATVVHSGIVSHHDSEGGTSYAPHIGYHYQVGGHVYVGDNYSVVDLGSGWQGSGRRAAQRKANEYPVGSQVMAYADPHNPSRSVLHNDAAVGMIVGMSIGGIAMLGGFVGGGIAMLSLT